MNIVAKLNALVTLAVALALGPFAVYCLSLFSDNAMEKAKSDFRLVGIMASDMLHGGYLDYVTAEVAEINRRKDNLRGAERLYSRLLQDLAEADPEIAALALKRQLAELQRQGVVLIRLTERAEPADLQTGSLDPKIWREVKDLTGQTLASKMTSGRVPLEGIFLVLLAPKTEGLDGTSFLGYLRPEADGSTFVMGVSSLEEARRQSDLRSVVIVRQLTERLADVKLADGAAALLFDGANLELLTAKGTPFAATSLPPELLTQAAEAGFVETIFNFPSPLGACLVRLEHFRPLDWYFAMLVPEAEVTAPAKRLVLRLLALALLGAAIAFGLSAAAGRRISGPIAALAKRASAASTLDFSSADAEAFFDREPLSRRADEIGRLALAFQSMGRTIVAHVKAMLSAARTQERLAGELAAARSIQLGILPPPGAAGLAGGLAVSVFLAPAKEVGGDLYDYFVAPDGQVALVVGDVSDKGVPAALFMSMTVTLVRETMSTGQLSPAEAMTRINEHLTANNPKSMFVTLFVGLFDPLTGVLEYANGGHCQPLAVGPQGLRKLEGLSGPMVGALDGLTYQAFTDRLAPDEILFLYTDGVTEAQNAAGGFFEQSRLEQVVLESAGRDPQGFNERVNEAVQAFRGDEPPSDDVAMLSFSAGRRPQEKKA
jgi:sigma-B regulation protein RsbU (phosphoserine phosphatase)